MVKKLFTSKALFIIVFIIVSVSADVYYHNRLSAEEAPGQLCRCDFRVFWTAAVNIQQQIKIDKTSASEEYPVYDRLEKFYHFRYAPFGALIMIPIGLIRPMANALDTWFVIMNIAMLSALLLLIKQFSRDFNITRIQRYVILWATFIISTRFYFMTLAIGQIDTLVALLFVSFLMAYVRNKEFLSGIIFALILQFKPFFCPMLIYFLFAGKKRLLLSTIIAFLSFLFAPLLVLGLDKTLILLKNWNEILGLSVSSQLLNYKNQSITYFVGNTLLKYTALKEFVSVQHLFYLLGAALTLSAYAALLWLKRFVKQQNTQKYKYVEISALIMASLLFSPIVWVAHFINLIIPFSVTLFFVLNSKKKKVLYAALSAFFILSWAIGTDLTNFIPVINKTHFINIALGTIFLAYALISAYKQNTA